MSFNVRDHIQAVVQNLTNEDNLDPAMDLFEAGFLTSIHVLDLIATLEDDFKIRVNPEDLTVGNFASIDRMVAFAEKALAAGN
jgi:acyl carrier protein